MTKKKSLFKNISLLFCLVPMLVLSLFCLFPKKYKIQSVSALGDQVITNFNFVSTNVVIPASDIIVSNGAVGGTFFNMLTLSFGVFDGVYSASVDGVCNNGLTDYYVVDGRLDGVPNDESAVVTNIFLNAYIRVNSTTDTNYVYKIIVSHSGQLTADIIKVEFSSYVNLSPNVMKPADFYNRVTYFDSNGEYIRFDFPLYRSNLTSHLLFDDRVYYFTTTFSDNTYYQNGYQDGLDQGLQDGYQDGYQVGLDVGSQSGYQDGFSAGVQSANDYSFIGLLGAVIDAPVTALTGLLNFEILGFNILAFVTGLITLALIIFIIKLCIGGK